MRFIELIGRSKLLQISFRWNSGVTSSAGKSSADEGLVAVIDGSDVLLTNFRSFVIPPPMSSFKLSLEDRVNAVGFIETGNTTNPNQFFVVTDSNKLHLYECTFESLNNQVTRKIKEVNRKKVVDIPESSIGYNWRLIDENTLVYATSDKIALLNTDGCTAELVVPKTIHNINVMDDKNILVGYTDGVVEKVQLDTGACKFHDTSRQLLFSLPVPCQQHEIVTIAEKTTVYSLNPSEMLYRDGEQYLGDITSLVRIGSYLAVTTVDELKFIDLFDRNMISERKIERGGLLVTIIANDSRTVLQMPRGNLEAIKPRTLSIGIVGSLLDDCQYAKCYDILRRERINLNLLVDHDPDKFFRNMVTFIEQVRNPNWLNLFLAELRNEDVTQTMYKQQYARVERKTQMATTAGYQSTAKIHFICQKFCEIAESQLSSATWLMLPKITSYVERENMERALELIWDLKKSESRATEAEVSADDALKYLLYLVNVDDLFNVALGMYDFDLVLFVARKSQKDPKEYLPFMNGLKQLEETYRKFQIDLHLKRYKKAVTIGIECGPEHFEECLKVIKDHVLFGHAMDLLDVKDDRYKLIASRYGDHLREKGKLREAGFMYERSGDLDSALGCAQKTVQWERCLSLKRRMNATEEEVKHLADSLIVTLTARGSHAEAAQLCATILDDPDRLLNILIEGNLCEKAAYLCKSEEETNRVREAYESFHGQVLVSLEDDFELYRKHRQRLAVVRREKREKMLNPDAEDYDMECDLYSDTTSMRSSQHTGGTRGTGKSFRSSKNRRKHERKLLNLKEGNVFEDIALIDSLHGLVLKVYNQQESIREILQAAIALNSNSLGRKLQVRDERDFISYDISINLLHFRNSTN